MGLATKVYKIWWFEKQKLDKEKKKKTIVSKHGTGKIL